jgi:two-component system chemotaxis response regulator CheB
MNDGASGLAAIKRCGGIALVQAPSDADARDMPIAVLEATPVDLSAPRAEVAEALLRFVAEPPGPTRRVPEDVRFEVEIAAGGRIDHDRLRAIAETSSVTCPDYGGVLSKILGTGPLGFRCQVDHAYTGKVLLEHQEGLVDEAMRVALRIIEERAALVTRGCRARAKPTAPRWQRCTRDVRKSTTTTSRSCARRSCEAWNWTSSPSRRTASPTMSCCGRSPEASRVSDAASDEPGVDEGRNKPGRSSLP